MAQTLSSRASIRNLQSLFSEVRISKPSSRTLTTIQRGPVQKLDFPQNIPKQLWSQIPPRFRPDTVKRKIVIHPPPTSEWEACKNPIDLINQQQVNQLDPSGARRKLFDPLNRDGAKVGDTILTTFKTGEPFAGVIMYIKRTGASASILVRNQLTRIGTEMHIKIFSPAVQSMEIIQKSPKRRRRARIYYIRKPEHDVGSVQKVVDQYLRQRALLTGAKTSKVGTGQREGKKK